MKDPLDHIPLPIAPSVIVHTASFITSIKKQDPEAIRLLKIATLKTCPIIFIPIGDQEAMAVLTSLNLNLATYHLQIVITSLSRTT